MKLYRTKILQNVTFKEEMFITVPD